MPKAASVWPWEHVAVGYLLVSLLSHGVAGRSPTDREAGVVILGSVAPDLIDKPLAWELGLIEAGYGPAHSLVVTVPMILILLALASWRGPVSPWGALAVAYLAHLPADLVGTYLRNGVVHPTLLVWPLRTASSSGSVPGLVPQLMSYYGPYHQELLEEGVSIYAPPVLLVFAVIAGLWIVDGLPGLRWVGKRFA